MSISAEKLEPLLGKLAISRDKPKIPIFHGRQSKDKDIKFSDWHYIVSKHQI